MLDKFTKERIENLKKRWWKKDVFVQKQTIIEAGIEAYLSGTQHGYILCLKTLLSEVEGILRCKYFAETGKGKGVSISELLKYLTKKATERGGSQYSLFMPSQFFKYLDDVTFGGFNLETGDLDMSRHSVSHGVAKPEDYTRARALQTILILDQIWFYI